MDILIDFIVAGEVDPMIIAVRFMVFIFILDALFSMVNSLLSLGSRWSK